MVISINAIPVKSSSYNKVFYSEKLHPFYVTKFH